MVRQVLLELYFQGLGSKSQKSRHNGTSGHPWDALHRLYNARHRGRQNGLKQHRDHRWHVLGLGQGWFRSGRVL